MISLQENKSSSRWQEYKSDHRLFDGRLVLHTGAQNCSLDEVLAAPVPAPEGVWFPIGHGVLLEEVIQSMSGFGLKVKDAAYSMSHEGKRFFGLLEVAGHEKPDYGLVIGLRNSVDKSFPASVCTGSRVFVCDNLAFSAQIMINRRHTTNILRDLPGCVARAIGQIGTLAERQEKRFDAYKNRVLSRQELNDLLVESVIARGVPVTKMLSVREQFEKPAHAEHNEYADSVWKLFNAYTEVWKGSMTELPRRTQIMHGLLDARCGVDFGNTEEIEWDKAPVEAN